MVLYYCARVPFMFGVHGGIRTHTVQFLKLVSPAVGLHALKFGGAYQFCPDCLLNAIQALY